MAAKGVGSVGERKENQFSGKAHRPPRRGRKILENITGRDVPVAVKTRKGNAGLAYTKRGTRGYQESAGEGGPVSIRER